MDIQIVNEAAGSEVTEFTIRDIRDLDYDSEVVMTPNFQAHIKNISNQSLGNMSFVVSYYDEEGNFLGFDKGCRHEDNPEDGLSISIPLTLPENLHNITCKITSRPVKSDFYSWAWRAGAILALLLLSSWIIKVLSEVSWS